MKIDENTINILKNFAKINSSIIVDQGNVIATTDNSKAISAQAIISTTFEKRFAIFKLNEFLTALSIFSDPDLIFHDNYVDIIKGDNKIQFFFCDEDCLNIGKFPTKPPVADLTVELPYSIYSNIEKGLSSLSLTNFGFMGDGENIYVEAASYKTPNSNKLSVKIGKTDKEFKLILNTENMKLLPIDYTVDITFDKCAKFIGQNIKYYIMAQA